MASKDPTVQFADALVQEKWMIDLNGFLSPKLENQFKQMWQNQEKKSSKKFQSAEWMIIQTKPLEAIYHLSNKDLQGQTFYSLLRLSKTNSEGPFESIQFQVLDNLESPLKIADLKNVIWVGSKNCRLVEETKRFFSICSKTDGNQTHRLRLNLQIDAQLTKTYIQNSEIHRWTVVEKKTAPLKTPKAPSEYQKKLEEALSPR